MARWSITGKVFQTVWVNPLTHKQRYNSASYVELGYNDVDMLVIHVLLPHESVPVGTYLETAPGLDAVAQQKMGIDAVCDFLKSRARVDFIRLARAFPDGTDDDAIEPHMQDGQHAFNVLPVERPARRYEGPPMQPGAFRKPKAAESDLSHERGGNGDSDTVNDDDSLAFEVFPSDRNLAGPIEGMAELAEIETIEADRASADETATADAVREEAEFFAAVDERLHFVEPKDQEIHLSKGDDKTVAVEVDGGMVVEVVTIQRG